MRPDPYWRQARLLEVVDGDTVDLVVRQAWGGIEVHSISRVRLVEADTPEVRGPEREEGIASEGETRRWFESCGSDEEWPLDVRSEARGSFGRPLALIRCASSGEELGAHLIRERWARPYQG